MKKFARCALVLILVTLIGTIAGYFYESSHIVPLYTSTAKLVITPGTSYEPSIRAENGGFRDDFVDVFKSDSVIKAAKEDAKTDEDIAKYLTVVSKPNSNIIELTVTYKDQNTAKRYVDAVAGNANLIQQIVPIALVMISSEGDISNQSFKPELMNKTIRIGEITAGVTAAILLVLMLAIAAFKPKTEEASKGNPSKKRSSKKRSPRNKLSSDKDEDDKDEASDGIQDEAQSDQTLEEQIDKSKNIADVIGMLEKGDKTEDKTEGSQTPAPHETESDAEINAFEELEPEDNKNKKKKRERKGLFGRRKNTEYAVNPMLLLSEEEVAQLQAKQREEERAKAESGKDAEEAAKAEEAKKAEDSATEADTEDESEAETSDEKPESKLSKLGKFKGFFKKKFKEDEITEADIEKAREAENLRMEESRKAEEAEAIQAQEKIKQAEEKVAEVSDNVLNDTTDEALKLAAQKLAAEALVKAEAERIAAENLAKAQRQKEEEARALEEKRALEAKQAEEAARLAAEQEAREIEEAKRKADEALRLASEQEEKARKEEERKLKEEAELKALREAVGSIKSSSELLGMILK